MNLVCQNKRCKHSWNYKGKSKLYTCCPKCMHKVNISKQLKKPIKKGLEPIKEV